MTLPDCIPKIALEGFDLIAKLGTSARLRAHRRDQVPRARALGQARELMNVMLFELHGKLEAIGRQHIFVVSPLGKYASENFTTRSSFSALPWLATI